MKSKLLLLLSIVLFAGCELKGTQPSADEQNADRQESIQKEGQAQAGLPDIHNFTEKKMLKMLYELRDNPKLINYAYLWSEVSGKWIFLGKCVGYGIPYSTQYSNPEKEIYSGGYQNGFGALPQSEPNGLFMPSSSQGTWLMMINPSTNEPSPIYVEPNVIVSPFKLPSQ